MDLSLVHIGEVLGILILTYVIVSFIRRPRNLPPGPIGWPFIGASNQLSEAFYLDFIRLGKKYGEIFSLYINSQLTIVLNSRRMLKLAFSEQGEEFAYRPHLFQHTYGGFSDEIFQAPYCKKWRDDKKFAVKAVRQFGFGTSKSEHKIQAEVNRMIDWMIDHKGKVVNLEQPISKAYACMINSILYSKSYQWDDSDLSGYIEACRDFLSAFNEAVLLNTFPPWFLKLFHQKMITRWRNVLQKILKYPLKYIKEHRATLDPNDLRDFIDVYLKEKDLPESYDHTLACTAVSFSLDAIDSITLLTQWLILYITLNPEVQERLSNEIRRTGEICLEKRATMPYTEAVIRETMRIANVISTTAEHTTIADTVLDGYHIPSGAVVFGNLYAVNMDPVVFPDPHKFKPERFLDSEGRLVKSDDIFPFGVGRRMCLGENLVKCEIFLVITNILQRFHLDFPPGEEPPSTGGAGSVIRSPENFRVVMTEC